MTSLDSISLVLAAKKTFDTEKLDVPLRAKLLRGLAASLNVHIEALVNCADTETHLGKVRLTGEVHRTCFQLNAFADYILEGKHLRSLNQSAVAGAPPLGRPQLEITSVPLGPVVVFAASNFPFAFSVLGGDTAAALAAGCPVIVKAHPAHLELSQKVIEIAKTVLAQMSLSDGWIGMLSLPDIEAGASLVMQPDVAAVSFTGSLQGGRALAKHISQRDQPIPFFGELGSINPVLVMPGFLRQNTADIAHTLADSIVQGAGQFCTSPGLIIIEESTAADQFLAALASRLDSHSPHKMLTVSMQNSFQTLTLQALRLAGVRQLTTRNPGSSNISAGPTPTIIEVSAETFLTHPVLHEEIFGPYAVVVRISNGTAGYQELLMHLQGSLTTTFWAEKMDADAVTALLPYAMQKAGRVLFGGVPTGVAVCEAQHHSGPWPASTRPETTSVGMRAVERFLRPVALQDKPSWLN
jgi:acyl-CoA reductase-like NAD-dependent aldehyde dehydrogenase